ncbi:MAG: sugar ABC transporter permease [Chloroflexota bacterium]
MTRRLVVPLGLIGAIAIIVIGGAFLADREGAPKLLAIIYDLIGSHDRADELRQGIGDTTLAKLLLGGVALLVGVGGVWLFYITASAFVGMMKPNRQARIIPWVFVLPAVALLVVFLVYPTVATIITSLTVDGGFAANYGAMFSGPMIAVFRNNLIWLVVATGGSVFLGLIIAGLFDRVRREALAKTFVFLPLAISLVGASVIWRFVYVWRPPSQPQYGLLNAVWTGVGFDPINWIATPPINTYLLILIMIWLQTGFAMVVLSAAIKGVSIEVIEAARLDGASERQLFFRVIVPIIKGSIITVATTIAIAVLKIFDIVYVTTQGRYDTDVVANRMFLEMFVFFRDGRAAALAVVLFIAVLPVMFLNLRNLRTQGIGQ